MIRVLVVDDQLVMREGLVALLSLVDDVQVVGDAGTGTDALALLDSAETDVVLMDLRMPVMDGVEATRRITAAHPSVAVVVLTTYSDDESITTVLQAGARGYLTKDAGRAEITAALRAVAAGQSTFDAAVSRRLVAALAVPSPPPAGPTVSFPPPAGSPPGRPRCSPSSPAASPTPTSPPPCSSARAPSRPTSTTSSTRSGVRSRPEAIHYAYSSSLASL
jgi:DNA-binding NarL/FixJ family response regulator